MDNDYEIIPDKNFKLTIQKKYYRIFEDYALIIDPFELIRTTTDYALHFSSPELIPITCRSYEYYKTRMSAVPINSKTKYLEIGAGLGGGLPGLIEEYDFEETPTVIEIADYSIMKHMLEWTRSQNIDGSINGLLDETIDRCKIYLDAQKIQLINLPFLDAVKTNSWLMNHFNIVVDLVGAHFYRDTTSDGVQLKGIEKELLLPNGEHIIDRD